MEQLAADRLKLLCVRAQYERDPQKLLALIRAIHALMNHNAPCEPRSKPENGA